MDLSLGMKWMTSLRKFGECVSQLDDVFLVKNIGSFSTLLPRASESTSNNRVKSGYENRTHAPIDMIPQAGARSGTADGKETTDTTLAAPDIETGPRTPSSSRSGSQSSNASSSGSSSGSRAPPRP